MQIDSTTLADLEVFQDSAGRGGILALLDRTETEVGRKALRRRLRNPHHGCEDIQAVQLAVEFFSRKATASLAKAGATEGIERYLASNIQVATGRALERIELAVRYRDVVDELKEGVSGLQEWIRQLRGVSRGLLQQGPPALVAGLCTEILEELDGLPLASGSKSISETLRLDRAYRGESEHHLRGALASLGELDSLRSMGRATSDMGWVFPKVVDSSQFVLKGEGLYHPFLEAPVRNPIQVAGGEPMVFLTGPNMAGKTTYLRAAALSVLLAQVGMSVPATRLEFTPVEVLLTSLTPSDNLRAGLSFFQAEVLRVREAAAHLANGCRAFVLFDEVFKGTNVLDALEASATVISGFAKAEGSGFIFSSHLVELVDEFQKDDRVSFHYFDGTIENGQASYSYRMKEGVSRQRFGLLLLGEAEIPELLAQIGS